MPRVPLPFCLLLLAMAAPSVACAEPLFPLPSGQGLALAGAPHTRTVQAAVSNPAGLPLAESGEVWFGLGAIGAGYEAGDFNNLIGQIEAFERDLREDNLSLNDAEALRERANAFLSALGRDGYLKVFANVQPPFLPLGGGALGGTFSLGVTGFTGARLSVLDDPVEVSGGSGNFRIQSDTAALGKAAAGAVVSLGYSRLDPRGAGRALSLGARLNYAMLELSRGVVALKNIEDTTIGATQNAIEEEFDRGRRRSAALGLDLGATWMTPRFSAGATLRNINEPKFEFGPLGLDCAALALPAERRNCEAAAVFVAAGRLPAFESYRLERQLRLDGALYTVDRTWSWATALDLNAARDPTGDAYQWLSTSGAFAPSGWTPGLRLGYRHNLSGGGLGIVSVGLSLLRFIHFDIASSTQMIEHEGHRRPRSALASLSFELPL